MALIRHRRLQRLWLETGVSGLYSFKEPESAMEGGDLARIWKGGKHGYLSPLMQAKAWGLGEARASTCAPRNLKDPRGAR